MDEQPTISEELRVALMQVWTLGFLDCMKGSMPPAQRHTRPLQGNTPPPCLGTWPPAYPRYALVTDDDTLPSAIAPHLVKLAAGCIDNAASFIAEVFTENPSTVYKTVYGVGFELCAAMNAAYGPIEVNVN